MTPDPMSTHLVSAESACASACHGPTFIVGRDAEGHWVALEEHGLAGGIFRTRHAAAHVAALETGRRPGAVRLTREPVSLRL